VGKLVSNFIPGLNEGWWMFFDTFWALVFGFVLSGMVQAFISRAKMKEVLGDHKPKTIAKASFFGVISSSCSYAASALAKSLFSKGADFTASMVFMFASTNLVIELGLVLWILIGWQFALAEFVGGSIMIILFSILLPRMVPANLIQSARTKLEDRDMSMNDADRTFVQKIRSLRGWSDAAGYTIGDFTMLRVELVVGFIVAGLASMMVPISFWRALFISGHGFWSALENAIIGPFLAFISFVCSIGNVPLAAALWKGGATFGGVIAFIFADLLALPLVLIYRKYYGTKLAVRLSLIFWLVMSTSGLITEGLFQLFSLIPRHSGKLTTIKHFGMNATSILNIIAAVVLLMVYWLHRNSDRFGINLEFSKDPVCGMQVRISDAPASYEYAGKMYYFCMLGCMETFISKTDQYV
jgi:uncharacterized membrane protein YraQ (UPF0718 family)/YHS domain-containing protein